MLVLYKMLVGPPGSCPMQKGWLQVLLCPSSTMPRGTSLLGFAGIDVGVGHAAGEAADVVLQCYVLLLEPLVVRLDHLDLLGQSVESGL